MATILVIDDDEYMRDMLRVMLERAAHDVVVAADGRQGLKRFREKPADLVITDILMPEKEGLETIMELRRDFPDVKILAISGGGAVGPKTYLAMASELGANRTLSKPFSMNNLTEILEDLL